MANTLTAVLPVVYEAMDVVSRELVGFIPAVMRNSNAERAAKGQTITYPIVPAIGLQDITPGATPPDNGDITVGAGSMTISKSKMAPIRWSGEEIRSLSRGDSPQYSNVLRDQFAQGFRALANDIENDLAALHIYAGAAYGTAGATPFGTANDFTDFAGVQKQLDEAGAPLSDRQLVLGSAAMANVRGKQSVLFKANEAGTTEMLRRGVVGMVEGLDVHSTANVDTHTSGTEASGTTDSTGYAIGATSIALASAGTGTIVAGDVITFGTDPNKYVVVTGDADISNGGTIVIQEPGLKQAITAAPAAVALFGGVRNMGFHRSAIHLVTRAPAMPDGGDSADDVTDVVDPVTGLVFQLALYREYRRIKFELGLAWGVKAVAPRHITLLLG